MLTDFLVSFIRHSLKFGSKRIDRVFKSGLLHLSVKEDSVGGCREKIVEFHTRIVRWFCNYFGTAFGEFRSFMMASMSDSASFSFRLVSGSMNSSLD